MSVPLSESSNLQHLRAELRDLLRAADSNYYRLVWLTGYSGGERSVTLREFSAVENGPLPDVGKGLTKSLLEISPSLRASSFSDCFADLLDETTGNPLCLAHLNLAADVPSWAGIYQEYETIGAAAMDNLVSLLILREFPERKQTLLVQGRRDAAKTVRRENEQP